MFPNVTAVWRPRELSVTDSELVFIPKSANVSFISRISPSDRMSEIGTSVSASTRRATAVASAATAKGRTRRHVPSAPRASSTSPCPAFRTTQASTRSGMNSHRTRARASGAALRVRVSIHTSKPPSRRVPTRKNRIARMLLMTASFCETRQATPAAARMRQGRRRPAPRSESTASGPCPWRRRFLAYGNPRMRRGPRATRRR